MGDFTGPVVKLGVERNFRLRSSALTMLSWSRATRDLLKSFGWGIRTLHQLGCSDDGAISSPPAPYHLAGGGRRIRTLGPPRGKLRYETGAESVANLTSSIMVGADGAERDVKGSLRPGRPVRHDERDGG